MIILEQLTKLVGSPLRARKVLASVNVEIPTNRRIALVGPSEEDKHIVIGLLGGVEKPSTGRVVRTAEVSFPVGQLPGFSKDLTVRINIAHVARLYGADVRQTLEVVESAFGAKDWLDKPYDDLPRQMRRPLGQVVAFALPFDAYILTDDDFRPPEKESGRRRDQDFSVVCHTLFASRLRTSGMIIPTGDLDFAQEYCDMGMVLHQGRLELFEDVGESFQMAQPQGAQRRRRRRSRG